MDIPQLRGRKRIIPLAVAAGLVGTVAVATYTNASDHQQTVLTELAPRLDITDVYVFPGSTDQRIVLAMTVASPLIGMNNTAAFDPNALYQMQVDNTQDGVADLVMQFSFDQLTSGMQTVDVLGPAAPRRGPDQFDAPFSGGAVRDFFLGGTPVIRRGALNTTLTGSGSATGVDTTAAGRMQVFAGVRDDPFFIDLTQFFRIIPDRRPSEGPLSQIGATTATTRPLPFFTAADPNGRADRFRARCRTDANGVPIEGQFLPAVPFPQDNPQQNNPLDPQGNQIFDTTRGCARDFLRGVNALAIVVELPESRLMRAGATGNDAQIGVWGTVSK